ncbi:Palmitoyl-protein thioesterase 1 [Schistosoma japonicum]|nr:Palmitoyl-protein thioesterase 1 [Schistosoma japonicum]
MHIVLTWIFIVLKCKWVLSDNLPVAIWHGMGDHGTSIYIQYLSRVIKRIKPETYVKCITTNNSYIEDVRDTVFSSINEQLENVCRMISEDKNLSNGLHMIGISQGGVFVRALVQKCSLSNVGSVISIGGPQQGVFGVPHCIDEGFVPYCSWFHKLLSYVVYTKYIQNRVVQAQYWHDPLKEDVYRKYSQFLADINQEIQINETYRENMKKVQRLVLVKFSNDTVLIPKESEWFGFYRTGSLSDITRLQDSILYTEVNYLLYIL